MNLPIARLLTLAALLVSAFNGLLLFVTVALVVLMLWAAFIAHRAVQRVQAVYERRRRQHVERRWSARARLERASDRARRWQTWQWATAHAGYQRQRQ